MITQVKTPTQENPETFNYFSKDQVKEFLTILKGNADQKKLEEQHVTERRAILQFVGGLDFYCWEYSQSGKQITLGQKAKRRSEFDSLIRDAHSVLARLKRISTGTDIVAYPSTIEKLAFMGDIFDEEGNTKPEPFINQWLRRSATKALPPLKDFTGFLETANEVCNPPSSKGRARADSTGLIKIIAMFYNRYIGQPKSSPDGGFYSAVQLTLEYLNLPCSAPRRAIENALSSFKETPPDKG